MARKRAFDEIEVVNIATDLFWKNGYHGVSTQDLIEAFGISKSSMYGAYSDKRSLFIIALENYRKNTSQGMIDVMKENKPFTEILASLLNKIVAETVKDDDCKGCFIVNTAIELAAHDSGIADILRENRQNIITAFVDAIQKGIEAGELSKKNNPEAIAAYFYSIINGLRVDAKIHKDQKQYTDIVEVAQTVLQRL